MPDMVTLIGPDGVEGDYPEVAKDALLGAGYTLPAPPVATKTTLIGPDGIEMDVTAMPGAAVDALLAAGFSWKPAGGTGRFLVRGGTTMIAEGLPEAAVTAMLGNGYAWSDEDPNVAPVEPADDDEVVIDIGGQLATMAYGVAKGLVQAGTATLVTGDTDSPPAHAPEPLAPLPEDDDQVQVTLSGVPSAIPMAFKDARGLVTAGQAEYADADLADLVQAHLAEGHAGQIRDDARDGRVEPSSDPQAQAVLGDLLDKALTEGPNASGKWTHPALPGKEYATKGAVTQGLNRLAKEASASPSGLSPATGTAGASAPPAGGAPPAEGKAAKMEHAKNLLGQVGGYLDDFTKMLALFEEIGGKRNIGEFSEPDLDKLIERLESEKAAVKA